MRSPNLEIVKKTLHKALRTVQFLASFISFYFEMLSYLACGEKIIRLGSKNSVKLDEKSASDFQSRWHASGQPFPVDTLHIDGDPLFFSPILNIDSLMISDTWKNQKNLSTVTWNIIENVFINTNIASYVRTVTMMTFLCPFLRESPRLNVKLLWKLGINSKLLI